jgi:hypothetical protein
MLDIKLFNNPNYWLCAFSVWLASFFILPNTQWVINLTYAILLVPTLLTLQLNQIKQFSTDFFARALVLFMLILIFAAYRSGNPLSEAKFSLIVLLFYFTVQKLPTFSDKSIFRYAWIIFIFILVYTLVNAFLQFQQGTWFFGKRLGSLFAFVDNTIHVANLLTLFLAVITYSSLQLKKYKSLLLAHCLALFACLVILQSRGMLPAWLFIVVFSLFVIYKNKATPSTLILTSALPIILFILLINSDFGKEILARADSYRFEIWQGYFNETMKCGMWMGCGLETNIHYITHDGISIPHAHSIYVANFSRTGIVGEAVMLILIFGSIWYGLSKNLWAGWMLAAGAIVLMFTSSAIIRSPNERWILIHLPLAYLIKLRIEAGLTNKP